MKLQNTLFKMPELPNMKKELALYGANVEGYELIPLTLDDMQEVEEMLYKKLPGDILYNHCYPHLYSYFNGVKNAYKVKIGDGFVIVAKKNVNKPIYSIHCPTCGYLDLVQLYEALSKVSYKPVRIIDLNEAQKDEIIRHSSNWKVHKMGPDVVYDLKEVSELKGGKFQNLRACINKFKREYPNAEIRIMDTAETAEDAVKVIDIWKKTQGKKYFRITTGRDVAVFRRFWKIVDSVNMFGYVVYNEGIPIAAVMGCRSPKNPQFGMDLTRKGLLEYSGVIDLITHRQLSDMYKQGILYANDAGLYGPGIKFNKSKFNPIKEYQMYELEMVEV